MGLSADHWAHVVLHSRRALAALPGDLVTPEIARLRALPTSRLATGPGRRRLARVLVTTPGLWRAVRERSGEEPSELVAWMRGLAPPPGGPQRATPATDDAGSGEASRAELARQRERARGFRDERDEALRQLDGALARAESAERRAEALARQLDEARDRMTTLEGSLTRAEEELDRAVERERRRHEGAVSSLRDELRDLRRRLQQRDAALRAARDRDPRTPGRAAPATRDTTDTAAIDGLIPGRPSVLREGVRSGTREHAELLLPRRRRVVVDGYNVTRTHRAQLTLHEQRAWLIRLLGGAAAGRGIDAEVVFDAQEGDRHTTERTPGVRVTYATELSADDEIEFRVAALPPAEPVTVVTDDRELRDRVRRYGADVIGTGPFLWVVE